jgi:hypothetical protein
MQSLREYAISFLSKPSVEFRFNDAAGFVQELLKSAGVLPENQDRLTAQQLFDQLHVKGGWNKHSFGALVFYGRSVLEIGSVAFMVDSHSVLICTWDEVGCRVVLRPINFRPGVVAVIKPEYAQLGCIT